jgi:serine phosphatase RsbU (regulator of sigma subunit)
MKNTILIVDDAPENIELIGGILKDYYNIKIATDGKTALKNAKTTPKPDLILLDIIMPGMNGYEVCSKLKMDKETQEIPVIFISSKSLVEDEAKGFESGAVDYITKPIKPVLLNARIKTHLTLYKQKKRIEEEKKINDYELRLAQKIQRHIIPASSPKSIKYEIYALYKPMRAVGGDFYDYFIDDNGNVSIMLADVSGHGIPAALITTMLKVYGTLYEKQIGNINTFINLLNKSLSNIIDENFVAMILGRLENNNFIFTNAGQCYPLLYKRKHNKIFKIKSEGVALGMFQNIQLNREVKIKLERGDKLFLYTDGIETLHKNPGLNNNFFLETIMHNKTKSVKEIIQASYKRINKETLQYKNTFKDDITIIGITLL